MRMLQRIVVIQVLGYGEKQSSDMDNDDRELSEKLKILFKKVSQSLPRLVLLSQIFDPAATPLVAQLAGLLKIGKGYADVPHPCVRHGTIDIGRGFGRGQGNRPGKVRDSCVEMSKLAVHYTLSHIGVSEVRLEGDRLCVVSYRLIELSKGSIGQAPVTVVNRVVRLKGYRPGVFRDRLVVESLCMQCGTEVVICPGIIRLEAERRKVISNGPVKVAQRCIRQPPVVIKNDVFRLRDIALLNSSIARSKWFCL